MDAPSAIHAHTTVFANAVFDEFEAHATRMRERARARRDAVRLKCVVDDNASTKSQVVDPRTTLGVPLPGDKWVGCTNLRTLRTLLTIVDDNGFERSPHQLAFHSAFERCTARVIYKRDWSISRPAIMQHNGWDKCSSEVLISTPRFVRLVGCDGAIVEYNQEQCRVLSYDGGSSLIRSFPSKVGGAYHISPTCMRLIEVGTSINNDYTRYSFIG